MTEQLDLDEVAVELEVKLGGKTFVARETTIKQNKELLRAQPDGGAEENDDSPEAQTRILDQIYPQLAQVLKDKSTGKPPSQSFVEAHLTTSGLRALTAKLNPGSEGN